MLMKDFGTEIFSNNPARTLKLYFKRFPGNFWRKIARNRPKLRINEEQSRISSENLKKIIF